MNLKTNYLNLTLRSPVVVAASPLSRSLDNIRRMEEAGAGAVVLYSLFEEQIRIEQQLLRYFEDHPKASAEDALALFPGQSQFHTRMDEYLDHITQAKAAVSIPIIASINCRALGSWTDVAAKIEAAGADALELNIYPISMNMQQSAEQIESMFVTIVRIVKETVKLPVAVKLAPYFTNLAYMARRLDEAGVNGLVLFNRFYQPDLDPRTLELRSDVPLSNPGDIRLPLHWIAALYGYLRADLAATSGIYTAEDVIKLLMAGAKVTMVASALFKDGLDALSTIDRDLRVWLDQNDYESVASLQGILRQFHSKDPSTFERAQYVRAVLEQKAKP